MEYGENNEQNSGSVERPTRKELGVGTSAPLMYSKSANLTADSDSALIVFQSGHCDNEELRGDL